MFKKILAINMLVIILLISVMGCSNTNKKNQVNNVMNDENFNKTGLPIVNEKITLKAVAKRRSDVAEFDGMPFFDMIEKDTNVNIDWECIPEESFNEKKNLMFASNELPDIFFCCLEFDDISKYYSSDYFLPLNNYIDDLSEYYKDISKTDPKILASSTCDNGNIYNLMNFDYYPNGLVSSALYVNKTWLNKLNLEIPKTTDDFYEMLKAFKNAKDLNGNGQDDEIPSSFKFGDNIRGIGPLFGSFGYCNLYNFNFVVDENNEVVFVPLTDQYKDAIKYFNKLYSEGLIDKESFTQNDTVYNAKLRNKPSIVGVSNFWSLIWAFGEQEEFDYEAIPPLMGPNGEQKWLINRKGPCKLSNPTIVISQDCKYPEVAFRWGDYLYKEDNIIQSYHGMYGKCIEKQEDGTIKFIRSKEMQESSPQLYAQTMCPGVNGIIAITESIASKKNEPAEVEKEGLNKFYNNYTNQYILPSMLYTNEENKIRNEIGSDINEYVKQMATLFITEGNIDEKWDDYKNTLEKMNLQKYIDLVVKKYNEYNETMK